MTDATTTITPERQPTSAPGAAPARRTMYGLMAEFETPGQLLRAAEKVRRAGYRWWDCHSPFPVHGLDKAMGIQPTILPLLVFAGGMTGAIVGLLLQWYTNAASFDFWLLVWVIGYDYFVSGKPMFSLPAFIPVTFEMTILLSASVAAFGMLLLNKLPQLYHPVFKSRRFARASDDRFFLVIEAQDPKYSHAETRELLDSLDPASIEELEA